MKTSVRIVRNTFFLALAQILNPLISMVFVLIMARDLGAKGLGIYTTALTLFSFFNLISALGLNEFIIREVAQDRSKAGKIFGPLFWLAMGSGVIAFILMGITGYLLHYETTLFHAIWIIGLALPFYTFGLFLQALLQAFEKMEYCAVILISETLWKTGLGVLVLKLGLGIPWIMWMMVLGHLLGCVLGLFFVHRHITSFGFSFQWETLKYFLQNVPTFLGLSIVVMVYWSTDIVMLSKMRPIAEVGFYSAGYRLLTISKGLVHAYVSAVFPVLAYAYTTSMKRFQKGCIQSIKFLLVTTLPLALGISFFAKSILKILYGSEFIQATSSLQILIWPLVFFPMANIYGNALISAHRQTMDFWINVIAAICNIGLNAIFIPRYGYMGAALATLFSILFLVGLQQIAIHKFLFSISFLNWIWKPVLSTIGMWIALKFVFPIHWVLALGVSLLVFVGSLFLFRYFTLEELHWIRDLWKHRKAWFGWGSEA